MKKLFPLAILFASVTAFAGGKPSAVSMKTIVKEQKESVLNPVLFTTCYHESGAYNNSYQAEADLAGWKSVMKQYAIIDQSDVFQDENMRWVSYAVYTPGNGVCNSGDSVCTWCVSIDNSPKLNLKQ